MTRRWLQSVDVEIDEATGAPLFGLVSTPGNLVSADGDGAFATSDGGGAVLVTHPGGGRILRELTIHNTGLAALLFSADDGSTWVYHPANFSHTYRVAATSDILAKNAVAGANISGCYRSAS